MARRLDPGMRGEGERGAGGGQGKGRQERVPREHTAKMAGLYRSEKVGEGKPMSWRSLGKGLG